MNRDKYEQKPELLKVDVNVIDLSIVIPLLKLHGFSSYYCVCRQLVFGISSTEWLPTEIYQTEDTNLYYLYIYMHIVVLLYPNIEF